jgi:hypothetical protein
MVELWQGCPAVLLREADVRVVVAGAFVDLWALPAVPDVALEVLGTHEGLSEISREPLRCQCVVQRYVPLDQP